MENKLQGLYSEMENLRVAWDAENKKNPGSFDKLLELQRKINETYEEIKKMKNKY